MVTTTNGVPPEHNGELRRGDYRRTAELFTSLPPHAIEAEISALGCALISDEAAGQLGDLLTADDYSKPVHGAIHDAIVAIHRATGAIDIVLLQQYLIDHGTLDGVGGQQYLIELASAVPTARHMREHATLVKRAAANRRLIELGGDIIQRAYDAPDKVAETIEGMRERLAGLGRAARSDINVMTLTDGYVDPASRVDKPLLSGLSCFDDAVEPQRGRVYYFVAPPKMGKSALLQFVLLGTLRKNPDACALYCMGEMTIRTLQERALMMLSGLTLRVLQRPDEQLSPLQAEAKQAGIELLGALGGRLHVLPGPFGCADIDAAIEQTGATIVACDYLQKVRARRDTDTRRDQVDEISRRLPEIAIERDAVLYVISSMSKAAADGAASMASAFKETSAPGYDGDAGYLASLPDDLAEDFAAGRDLPDSHPIRWRCLGDRNNNARSINTVFDRHTLRFFSLDRRSDTNG